MQNCLSGSHSPHGHRLPSSLLPSSVTTSDQPGLAEIEKSAKSKLKKTEAQEKNPRPSKEKVKLEKQEGES
ncbi:thymosin beta-4-like [Tenrec ecaudatus]|uniref:thymosin beta-4-like n=1 Tax=Tenrec ecaudatus TaxID=94439 RepID=UPI003F5A5DFC